MSHQKPIVIDIEVKKCSPTRSPPIAAKLLKMKNADEAAPTLEDFNAKLLRAEELRNVELARRAAQLTGEKISKVLERKSTQEKAQLERLQRELEQKSETADQLRRQAIETRVSVAKKESEKVEKALSKIETMEKDKESELQHKMA